MPEIPPFSPGAYGFLPHSKMVVIPGIGLEALQQHGASLGVGARAADLGIEEPGVGSAAHVTAAVDGHGHASRLEPRVVDLRHLPGAVGEDLVEGHEALRVGREGLVDRAVAEAQVDHLVRKAQLAVLTNAVPVAVQEHVVLVPAEPGGDGDVADVAAAREDHGAVADDLVEVIVPDDELVRAVGDAADAEVAVGVGLNRLDVRPAAVTAVDADPGPRVAERVVRAAVEGR